MILGMKHIKHLKIQIFKTSLNVSKGSLKRMELHTHICKRKDFRAWMLGVTTEHAGVHLYQGPSQGRTLESSVTLCKPWLTSSGIF